MKKLLFITNGHGEDLVAAEIIQHLGQDFDISVLPVVGEGSAFKGLKVKILGSQKKLPSGGFSLRNFRYLIWDIYAGLVGNTIENIKLLRKHKKHFDLVISIGDIVPIIGARLAQSPFIFIGVNKSSYYRWFGYSYTPWEKLLLQNYAQKVFVRDKLTETKLRSHGIKISQAEYVGNPLMDCIEQMTNDPSTSLGTSKCQMTNEGKIVIGFLPGTRDDAKINLEDFERIVQEIIKLNNSEKKVTFVIATTLENVPSNMEKKPFADVLSQSDLIIGLSGTGNEQAAGCGIPVISFCGRGSQYNKKFAQAQKQLLGNALDLILDREPIIIAAEVWNLLKSPDKMEEMGKAGKERMGHSGSTEKIADFIIRLEVNN
ncbi:MAG: hypothetical protein HQ596_07990 [Candidatus Saganbacteria bacterium]|nr:hypothetical protein [Candidatus Saganbacteria bacterium]